MITDLKDPFTIHLDKFSLNYKKDDINPYMTKKLLRKKYESIGYKTIPGDDFETSLLLTFVRKTHYIDKYIKVKLGEYKPNTKVEEYNQELLDIFDLDKIQKLLFVCRICSYIGDPSFPEFIVYNQKESALRFVYNGDELLPDRLVFILLSKFFGIEIKLAAIDFSDNTNQENLKVDILKAVERALQSLEKRVNLENSLGETNIDLRIFKKWITDKQINSEEFLNVYNNFNQAVNAPNKLKELLVRLEGLDTKKVLGNKERPENLKALREALGVNMLEAVDVLNLWDIIKR